MNAQEIIDLARADLDDLIEGYQWDDTFMLGALNRAERRACCSGEARVLFDDSTASICQIATVALQPSYALSQKIITIEALFLDGTALTRRNREELDRDRPIWRTQTGTPIEYVIDGYRIRLTPIPAVTGTITLDCHRFPLADMDFMDSPEIPENDHEFLKYWIEHEAWSQRDPDFYNPQSALQAAETFRGHFGEYIPADKRIHLLHSQTTLTLRGTAYQNFGRLATTDDDW